MKILTAEQMREVDRRTIEMGIPGIVLMENAGQRVVEFLEERFAPLSGQRIVVICGKGNNGGDGMVIARQLHTRFRPEALHVVLAGNPEDFKGDALANYRMLQAAGCAVAREITAEMRMATIVLDALLGTGLRGAATGRMAEFIHEINNGFPLAKIVAVDIPSGLESDAAASEGDIVQADYTVTFTAPKIGQILAPNCQYAGELRIAPIGSPPSLYEADDSICLSLTEPEELRPLLAPREPMSHKGTYGHVLVVAGSRGKTGAAAMAGMGALRSGAGLVTIASAASAIPVIASHAPELMTEPLPETDSGAIAEQAAEAVIELAKTRDVVAIGPGLGAGSATVAFVRWLFAECPKPMVLDADALNALAGSEFRAPGAIRILTPHPGEMRRLDPRAASEGAAVLEAVRRFASERGVILVRKGYRTLIASPDGKVWVNPTGTPAMATGGTGDVLTGMLAGLLAQHTPDPLLAARAAVYLHGLAGQLGASELSEQALIATDLLAYLPEAIGTIQQARNGEIYPGIPYRI